MNVDQLFALLQTKAAPLILVDVRTPMEREIASILPSLFIPLYEIEDRLSELEAYRGHMIVLYCHAGVRSARAAQYLRQEHHFPDVHNLEGGIDAWSTTVDPSVPRY